MNLTHTVYESVASVPEADWAALTAGDGDLTMDRRLLGAFEATMRDGGFFCIVIRDEAGPTARAVGLACAWLTRIDLADYPWLQNLAGRLRKLWPNCLRMGALFCGLPIPAGQNHLRLAAGADPAAVLAELHAALTGIARKHKTRMVIVKEFDAGECAAVVSLERLGYLRGEIPPRHVLSGEFGNFDNYLASLKARYRAQVKRSLKKFAEGGFRVEQVRGPEQLPRVYTDDVHRLYEAVWRKSPYRLEFYTPQFMREFAKRMGDDVSLTCIYRGDRLAGFALGAIRGKIYHNLYSGLDYELNAAGDVYFNLFYRDLDYAWRRGADEIHMGQTSDDFKSRLGSRAEPMYLYVRPTGRVMRWGIRVFAKWALPKVEAVEGNDVFGAKPAR